uniref:Mitogenactivated protein kinase kinase putative n=1 Tax=Albugo laibachii Nc14 TaxID=890382 RepID=F0WU18_9STRA|nr:mitogenactivated protein kinase kinase putative [Albugo laibachii Nc14]CCA24947.1 mitogenactivated protein kinase kinase putative [Albugo laibachii Nc14]|eukprot:CCA24947.1 mitogenactivated protein kinase kinase putative [Albugo laibachii Nc14]
MRDRSFIMLFLPAVYFGIVSASCTVKDRIAWFWMGDITSRSITFKLGLNKVATCHDATVMISLFPQDASKSFSVLCDHVYPGGSLDAPVVDAKTSNTKEPLRDLMECFVSDLSSAIHAYRYQIVVQSDGSELIVAKEGKFTTPPAEGTPFSFRLAFSSCADEHSNPKVFSSIQAESPFLFLHMGDLHYENIAKNDVTLYRNAFNKFLTSPAGKAMEKMDVPIAYMWDDHDFGPDNSDRTAPGRNASVQAYREFVPHYPLEAVKERPQWVDEQDLIRKKQDLGQTFPAIYQAFTIGRVRFILTDLRSMRTPNEAPDMPSKTVLGVAQKQWFKEELERANADKLIRQIIWCSTMPWIDDERKWGHFKYEQQELVSYLKAYGITSDYSEKMKWKTPLVIVSGDAHMLAVDDGSNSPGNLITFHAAALGRPGSIKGGPYSHGVHPGPGQYGILDIVDDSVQNRICIQYRGMQMDKGKILEYDSCNPSLTPPVTPHNPPSIFVRQLLRRWKKTRRYFMERPLIAFLALLVIFYAGKKGYSRLKRANIGRKKQK